MRRAPRASWRSVLAGLGMCAMLSPGATPASAVPPEAPACPMFPADSHWHADISSLPVDPSSASYIANGGADSSWHADFGSGTWNGGPIGIPYTVVDGAQTKVAMSFEYADESDPGPYPFPADAKIEGGSAADGDRHVLVVDKDACRLYETWSSYRNPDGSWRAGSGAVWDLRSNALRPFTWTSADAAGLPILPGLVRYDEVAAGRIDHAIRVTVPRTAQTYVWPARHEAGQDGALLPKMGMRLRLKSSVDISGFPAAVQVILRAAKQHGMVVADNGSAWYLSGVPDERWDNDALRALHSLRGSDLEVVDAGSMMVHPDSGAVRTRTCPPTGAGALSIRSAYSTRRVGERNYLGGYLTSSGCAVPGEVVGLFVRTRPGGYTWHSSTTTNGKGQYQFVLEMRGSYDAIVVHSASARAPRAVSTSVHVTVVR